MVNNTQKLDDIRRRLRVIETRLDIIQRAGLAVFERVAGGSLPPRWAVHESEQKFLARADAANDEE
jgi:hypothetical protein